jgi:hypothetical protein
MHVTGHMMDLQKQIWPFEPVQIACGSAPEEAADFPEEVADFAVLHEILSGSSASDAYCRSSLYFAVTGRGKAWTLRHGRSHLIMTPHPNIRRTLLVFFPFISDTADFANQIAALAGCRSFLNQFDDILLARIPESMATGLFDTDIAINPIIRRVDLVREETMDWVYPSYDLCLQRLAEPRGSKLKTYRRKVRTFLDRNEAVKVVRFDALSHQEIRHALNQISASWVKRRSARNPLHAGETDIGGFYRKLADLVEDPTLRIDGLILKRATAYVAFGLWERRPERDIVPVFAALPRCRETGLCEYIHYCMACQLLEEQRYRTMCIGGSETIELDRFKRKFYPIEDHRLRTLRLLSPD